MQPRLAGKPGGFVNVTTNYSLGAVSVTTNNANQKFKGLQFSKTSQSVSHMNKDKYIHIFRFFQEIIKFFVLS